jgi:hypothetical protein
VRNQVTQEMTNSLTKLFFKLNAKSIVDEAYRGLLNRGADAEGSTGYVSALQRDGDLPALLKDLAKSEERWKLTLSLRANELMEDIFLGLGYKPKDAPGPEEYVATWLSNAKLSTALSHLTERSDFVNHYVSRHGLALANQVLTGLFGYQPDEALLKLYEKSFSKSGALDETLNAIAATDAFWASAFRRHSGEVKELVYTGLFQPHASESPTEDQSATLSRPEELVGLLNNVVSSERFRQTYWSRISRDVAIALFRGVTGRDPDEQELWDALNDLQQPSDIASLSEKLVLRKETLNRQIRHHAAEVVDEIFRGLLQRNADSEGVSSYIATLRGLSDLAPIISSVSESNERWQLAMNQRAEELIESIYDAILGRKPDMEEMKDGLEHIHEDGNLQRLLAKLVSHKELKSRHFEALRSELVNASYRGVFKRDADQAGLVTYNAQLKRPDDFARVLRLLISSDEFLNCQHGRAWPHPGPTLSEPAFAFLHIQKTAGTSLQQMLREGWPKAKIYTEHADTLHMRSPGELSTYSMYCGHFNHDSLRYIPRDNLAVFAFLREPKKRLVSLYYFLRAHEPDHETYSSGHARAGTHCIESFFKHEDTIRESGFWNHMTWAIMGARQWLVWRNALSGMPSKEKRVQYIESEARPAIEARMSSLWFIGIQEDFDRSVSLLFDSLQLPRRDEVRKDHTLEGLMRTDPKFKQNIDQQDISQEVMLSLSLLTELDVIVYEIGKELYVSRLNQLNMSQHGALAS